MSVFFSSRKTVFEKLARHLLDSKLSIELPKLFLIAILLAPWYILDRSRKFLTSWQLLNTWWIDRASSLASGVSIPRQLLDTRSVDVAFLDTFSTDVSTPPRHLICRDLLRALFNLLVRSACHFLNISLDWLLFSLPHTLFSPSNLFYKVSSSFTKLFFTW